MTVPAFVTLVGYAVAGVALVHLISLRKPPASTLAWAWGILLFPFFGVLLYWGVGADRLRRRRLRRRAGFAAFQRGRREGRREKALASVPRDDAALARVLARLNGIPPTSVDGLRLLPSAAEFFDALAARIDAARHHVHIQFFIWRDDAAGARLRDALVAAARRGVEVRVLIDEIGSVLLRSRHFTPLVEAGGEFSWFFTFNPLRNRYLLNLRNHRKVQIIDGAVAFVGGMNVGVEYQGLDPDVGPWRDLQAEFTGPLACTLQECFADDWFFATGRRLEAACYYPEAEPKGGGYPALVLAGGPDDPTEPMQKSLMAVLNHASKRAWLTTGYFVPNGSTLSALQLCAARGVDVRLLVTEKTDHPALLRMGRSYYLELLAAGVRIFEFSAALNHTKAGVFDEDWVLVGSANLDNRSMRVNFELSVLARHPGAAAEFAACLEKDFAACIEITPAIIASRPWYEKVLESTLRPFAPLF